MVSVIIPVYNGELYIGQAIESIINQSYKDVEIIVVDDGSTDNTEKEVKRFENIKYIYQKNSGPSAARNKGMEISKGEYIAFLDSDDIYKENKLQAQINAFEKNKDADIVYNDCIAVDKNLNYINTLKSEGVYENREDFLCMLLFRQIISIPPSIMLRRKCFEEGYSYNARYKHAEDYEYIIRLARRYKFAYVPEPLYIYRRHENNLTNAHSLQQQSEVDVIRELGFKNIEKIVEESSFPLQEKRFILAKIYIKMNENRLAKNILLQLSGDSFQNPYLWFYIGNCSYFLGESELAAEYYKNAIECDGNMSEAYNNLACVYAEKDRTKALGLLETALIVRPNYMDAEYNMKQILGGQKDFKITIRELRKVLTSYTNTTGHL